MKTTVVSRGRRAAKPVSDEQRALNERAWRAVRAFNRLIPQLRTYVRAIANDRNLQVQATDGETRTDGRTVYIRPPLKLGDEIPHEKAKCLNRDPITRRQLCPACDQHEMVMACIYHEVAHIIFGTMVKPTPEGLAPIYAAINEWHPADACDHAAEIFKLINEYFSSGSETYLTAAAAFDLRIKLLINALEDARVNSSMFSARPGTRAMMDANVAEVFESGIDGSDEEYDRWQNRGLDEQVFIGLFLKASEYYRHLDELSDEAKEVLSDDHLQDLIAEVARCLTVHEVVDVSMRVWRRLQEMGRFYLPKCVKPEIKPELPGEPGGEGDDASGDAGSGDGSQHGTGSPGDSSSSDGPGTDDGAGPRGNSTSSDSGVDATAQSQDSDDDSSGAAPSGSRTSGDESNSESDSAGGRQGDDSDLSGSEPDQPNSTGSASSKESASDEDAGEESDADSDDGVAGKGLEDEDRSEEEAEASEGADGTGSDDEYDLGDGSGDATGDSDADGGDSTPDGRGVDNPSEPDEEGASPPDHEGLPEGDDLRSGDGEVDETLQGDRPAESDDDSSTGADDLAAIARRISLHDLIDQVNADSNTKEFACGHSEMHTEGGNGGEMQVYVVSAGDAGDAGVRELAIALLQSALWDAPSVTLNGMVELSYPNSRWGWQPNPWNPEESDPAAFTPGEAIIGRLTLAAKLALEANQRSKYEHGRRSGKVDRRALAKRVPADDPHLMRKKLIPGKRSHHVVIGMDCSGSTASPTADSMTTGQYTQIIARIKRAVFAQAEHLARLGITFEVWAHSAGHDLNHDRERESNGWLLPIKRADQAWDRHAKQRLAAVQPMSGNVDGHTLEFYRKQAEKSSALQKHVCYYTDGAMPAMNYADELEVLKRNIEYCEKHNINLLSVGIETDSPAAHGFNNVRVDSDDDLIKVVDQLKRAIT